MHRPAVATHTARLGAAPLAPRRAHGHHAAPTATMPRVRRLNGVTGIRMHVRCIEAMRDTTSTYGVMAHLRRRHPSPPSAHHHAGRSRPLTGGAPAPPHGWSHQRRLHARSRRCKISHKMRRVAHNLRPSSHRRCADPPPPAPPSPRLACATRARSLTRALSPPPRAIPSCMDRRTLRATIRGSAHLLCD